MKKLLSLLLGIVMMLTPVLALAASPADLLDQAKEAGRSQTVDFSLSLNEDLLNTLGVEAITEAVTDLLDVTSFAVTTGEQGPGKIALRMDGDDVVSVQVETVDGVNYIGSNLLGSKPVSFTENDLYDLAVYAIDMMAKEGLMSEEESGIMQVVVAMIPMLAEEVVKILETAAAPDWTPVLNVVNQWAERIEIIDPVTVAGIDTPTAGQVVRLSFSDLWDLGKAVIEVYAGMCEPLLAQFGFENPADMVIGLVDDQIAQLSTFNYDFCLAVMYGEDGEIVYGDLYVVPKAVTDIDAAVAYMNETELSINYKRLTLEGNATHNVQLKMDDSGVQMTVDFFVDVDNVAVQTIGGKLVFAMDGELMREVEFAAMSENDYGDACTEKGMMYYEETTHEQYGDIVDRIDFVFDVKGQMNGKDAEVVTNVTLKANNIEVGTVTIKATTGDPLPTLASGESVSIIPMVINADFSNPADPLNTYITSLNDNAMTTMMLLMQKLPMSVLMLFMQ